MNSDLLKIKAKDLKNELEPCIQFYRERSLALAKPLEIFSVERLFLEEILRVLSYLNSKQVHSEVTLRMASELLNEIYPEIFWNSETVKLNIQEYSKKKDDIGKVFDSELFELPKILEIAKEYDDVYGSDKFDKVSLFLVQIFNLLIQSDGIVTSDEELFLSKYNVVINKKKFAPLMNDTQFANQLTQIYDDFFGYTESLKKQINEAPKENSNSGKVQKEGQTKSKEDTKVQPVDEKPESLEDLMKELNSLIGLSKVKAEIENVTNVLKVEKIRKEKGMKIPDKSLHLVFTGNPGTGKTTIGRILARIYRSLGVLEKGQLIEIDRSGLVAGFVGQTAAKTLEVCKSALDGVLFIDEAYALAEGGENDFGKEAINTILKFMEDNRARIVVVVAGYTKNMEDFINKNPGLKSRFNKYIQFDDYTPEELMNIFEKISKGMKLTISEPVKKKLMEIFTSEYEKRDSQFGNGRFARNLFEKAYMQQANRLVKLTELTEEALCTLEEEDIIF